MRNVAIWCEGYFVKWFITAIAGYSQGVFCVAAGSTQRLTYAHKGGRSLADDPLTAGIPSYVMQEEFNRYQGYWWQPACTGMILVAEKLS